MCGHNISTIFLSDLHKRENRSQMQLVTLMLIVLLLPTFLSSFKVYWNFPSKTCETNYSIPFSNYSIITNQNVSFFGDEIVIFYEFTFALYPYFKDYNKSTPINGGLPQLNNLSLHLIEVGNNVTSRIKNENFTGLGVIDVEEWRPLFSQNGYQKKQVYQNESIELAKTHLPNDITTDKIKEQAVKEFNDAAKKFLIQTINKTKTMRPGGKWGFYGFPYCNYDAGTNNTDFECSERYRKWNDEMMFLYNESTALFPSIYLGFNATSEHRFRYVHAILKEALRISKKYTPPLPIYAYTKIEYNPLKEIDKFYDESDLYTTIKQPADLGIDGIIIWSSSTNMTLRCKNIQEKMNDIGPNKIKKTIDGHRECRKNLCTDHGKCVLKNNITFADVTKNSYDVTLSEYKCECDNGYNAINCTSQNTST